MTYSVATLEPGSACACACVYAKSNGCGHVVADSCVYRMCPSQVTVVWAYVSQGQQGCS